jgi:DNA-3-methyladenine glycosylase II
MEKPDYWEEAKACLAARDAVLAKIIMAHPEAALSRRHDPFATLARSIVGQQISIKAADSVWAKLLAKIARVTPENMLACDQLRECGLSARKIEYLTDLSVHFSEGHLDRWEEKEDEALIDALVRIRGIGRWTAEMFLIFQGLRPDVFPLDDLGLRRAICLHYNQGNSLEKKRLLEISEPWRPWRSVATWYLWRSLDPVPVEY